jgi:hypothetical protein
LHANQRADVDTAIRTIIANPAIGQIKTGDLAGVQVYKFKMAGQLTLLAYTCQVECFLLTLLALGTHENFYRNLKR